jgi:hypothetical protein
MSNSKCVPFTTKLRKSIDLWNEIAPEPIVDWIRNGVILPFIGDKAPGPFILENKGCSKEARNFITQEISDLILCDLIEEVDQTPHCVSPIHCIPKKYGSFRLITDLRWVNSHCAPPKFSNEGIKEVLHLVQPDDRLITIDIKQGFFHIPVHKEYRKYLGFQWNNRYYQWKCLPFGLNGSPYFFYKTIRSVVGSLRQKGLRIVAFVDDFLLMSKAQNIDADYKVLVDTLENLGLTINYEKSKINPSECKEYIGFVLNTVNSDGRVWIKVPPERIRKVRRDITKVLQSGYATARVLARIAGQCISMCTVILPCKLLLRNLYRLLGLRTTWQDILTLDSGTIKDLKWWWHALQTWNGRAVTPTTVDIQMTTDASGSGWGAHVNGLKAMGYWNTRMSMEHSNYRELMAVLMAILSFQNQLRGKNVQLLSDNITTIAYLNHLGGCEKKLSDLSTAIWSTCYELGVTLQAKHLAGKENYLADQLSRASQKYSWMLHPKLFHHIDTLFGPHDIDRFASMTTTQLPRYNSLYHDPFTEGVDALAQTNWSKMNNYVNAPFFLIPRVLDILESQSAVATIVAPIWPAQHWFRRLQKMAIRPPLILKMNTRTIWSVNHRAEPLRNKSWRVGVWRVSGKRRL